MGNSTVRTYETLKEKVGEESARVLIEYIDSKIEKEAVTKLDLTNAVNSLHSEIKELETRIKLYFLAIAGLILLTNPKVIDLVGRVLGIIK